MSQISRAAAKALHQGMIFNGGNTTVQGVLTPLGMSWEMRLHGNLIAKLTPYPDVWALCNPPQNHLFVSTCGYDTQTTRSRLNALNGVHVQKVRGVLHLNGEPWDGETSAIN